MRYGQDHGTARYSHSAYLSMLNGGASEHKAKRKEKKDKYQLQEQLIYLGSCFIELHPFHFHTRYSPMLTRVVLRVLADLFITQHLYYCPSFVRALPAHVY